jgi:hypothetical protein
MVITDCGIGRVFPDDGFDKHAGVTADCNKKITIIIWIMLQEL